MYQTPCMFGISFVKLKKLKGSVICLTICHRNHLCTKILLHFDTSIAYSRIKNKAILQNEHLKFTFVITQICEGSLNLNQDYN